MKVNRHRRLVLRYCVFQDSIVVSVSKFIGVGVGGVGGVFTCLYAKGCM